MSPQTLPRNGGTKPETPAIHVNRGLQVWTPPRHMQQQSIAGVMQSQNFGHRSCVAVLFLVAKALTCVAAARRAVCDPGRVPGNWKAIGSDNNAWTWNSFDPHCSLTNELGPLAETACAQPDSNCEWPSEVFTSLRKSWDFKAAATPAVPDVRPVNKILVVGDSVDRYFGFDICGLAGLPVGGFAPPDLPSCTFHKDRGPQFHDCMTCVMPSFIYAKEAAFSIHLEGPLEHNLHGFADERAVKVSHRQNS